VLISIRVIRQRRWISCDSTRTPPRFSCMKSIDCALHFLSCELTHHHKGWMIGGNGHPKLLNMSHHHQNHHLHHSPSSATVFHLNPCRILHGLHHRLSKESAQRIRMHRGPPAMPRSPHPWHPWSSSHTFRYKLWCISVQLTTLLRFRGISTANAWLLGCCLATATALQLENLDPPSEPLC